MSVFFPTKIFNKISDWTEKALKNYDDDEIRPVQNFKEIFTTEPSDVKDFRGLGVDNRGNLIAVGKAGRIAKFDDTGELVWSVRIGETERQYYDVAFDSENNIYTGANTNELFKLNEMGELEWTFEGHDGGVYVFVDGEDNIYSIGGSKLFKLDSDMNILWTYTQTDGLSTVGVYVDRDGYVYGFMRTDTEDHRLVKKWDQSNADTTTPPTVEWEDDDGTMRMMLGVDHEGYVYLKRHNSLWKHPQLSNGLDTREWIVSDVHNAVITNDGIFAVDNKRLAKIDFDGNVLWEYPFNPEYTPVAGDWGLAVDANNNVCFSHSYGVVKKLSAELQVIGIRKKD